jgi:hypothetical protein
LLVLSAPLVKLSDPALDLPEFPRHSDLLGQCVCFVQVLYRPLRVAFELTQDRQGAQVGYPTPLVNLGAFGETVDLFSGTSLVYSSQQRFDLVMESEALLPSGGSIYCCT